MESVNRFSRRLEVMAIDPETGAEISIPLDAFGVAAIKTMVDGDTFEFVFIRIPAVPVLVDGRLRTFRLREGG